MTSNASIINSSVFLRSEGIKSIQGDISDILTKGCSVLKISKFSIPNPKTIHIRIDNKMDTIRYNSKKNKKIPFQSIVRVEKGMTSKKFAKYAKKYEHKKDLCMSIFYHMNGEDETQSFDLIFDEEEVFNTWYASFEAIVKIVSDKEKSMSPHQKHRLSLWKEADADNSNTLDKGEIKALLQYMNFNTTNDFVDQIWKELDTNGDNELDPKEFENFLNILRNQPAIDLLFAALVENDLSLINNPHHKTTPQIRSQTIPIDVFTKFLTVIQKEKNVDDDYSREVLELSDEAMIVDFEVFYTYITSMEVNEILSPAHKEVYQDMTHPIQHYWIMSSHNTYLEGDQLNSNSSVNRYVSDMLKGYRCVELDCWDGKDGQPIIFHGHTNTGKIKFEDVIYAIKQHAFTSSDYPLILSIENHCSVEQQEKMANIMIEILGEVIAKPTDYSKRRQKTAPSPLELIGRVLIKGKIPKEGTEEIVDDYGVDEDKEDEMDESQKKEVKGKKIKVSPLFASLVWMPGAKVKDIDATILDHMPTQCSSFTEGKLAKFGKTSAAKYAELNQHVFSRIYPAGTRIDSSNYDPTQALALGAQIVAINSQTPGPPLHVVEGLFRDNGKCGYLLKPKYLREGSGFNPLLGPYPTEEAKLYKLKIISGHSLPKPSGATKGEVIDPYVKVEIFSGYDKDDKRFTTQVIDNNGFNPEFNFSCEFNVAAPDIAIIKFSIWDKDLTSADDFIGVSCLPLNSIREGIRTVGIYNNKFQRQNPFGFAHLVVDFQILDASSSKESETSSATNA